LMKKWFSPFTRLSKKYNKTAAQLSLNWLISKKNVIAIQRTSNIAHLKENLGAVGWQLSDEDYEKLDRDFKRLWYVYKVVRHAKTFIPKRLHF
ncbi:aldo/keto reductase, partial [Candidatus Woesearchaeota archaeon]|nr:aldo/keto reductase [Candidatus Woesearchaeota archaeon]